MKYKIFGNLLQINTNDEVLIDALRSSAGHFTEDEIETIGKIRFEKISVTQLRNKQPSIEEMRTTLSYVQPTMEYSTIYQSLDGARVIHFYERYYLIEYLFDLELIAFYYTDNLYEILDLLSEFLKYYIFQKALFCNKFPLHSSCVLKNDTGKCVVFVGDSGCGKSSNALFASFNNNFTFMNDEITYIACCGDRIVAIPTTDKFKICETMFLEIKDRAKLDYFKINNEYMCDFSCSVAREDNMFDIISFVVLVRDDGVACVEKNCLSKLELYDIILRNLHFTLCNTRKSQLAIFECVNKIMQNCNIISIRYPTKLIREVNKLI